jgi:hypothetical protein
MRDVVLCLRAAAEHQAALNRIRLQKYVYLTDALSLVIPASTADGHITYKTPAMTERFRTRWMH